MKKRLFLYLKFVLLSILFFKISEAQTTFYNLNTLQKIEINFSQTNWDYQLDTAKAGADGYILAGWVKVNGVYYDSVGVKYKGNSSYNPTSNKNPFHIELDHFKNQNYQGYTDIKLSNGYSDPSMIREVLSYDILKNYMHCPKANFAQLYINGVYVGVYSNAESITKKFCGEHFFSGDNIFIKCNPIINPSPSVKSNLKFINSDSSSYFNYYEIKSNYGWNYLTKLCDTLSNFPSKFENNLDADRVIWMIAFNSVLVNLDSYNGVFAQNYYLYKDYTNHFNPIIWDLNMSFAGFPHIGSGNSVMGSLSITNLQQLTPFAHATDAYWPLINIINNNAVYKRKYVAHMRTILNEMFVTNLYQTKASQFQAVIDTALQNDTNKFFTYTQFQNALTNAYSVGSYSVPGISTFMTARTAYLQTLTEFTAATPTISGINAKMDTLKFNSLITVTATITNANSSAVTLGYRISAHKKFQYLQMFDDGLHGDIAAGDNIFGNRFSLKGNQIEYYIYAENNNAGIFSPERAEHEFYEFKIFPNPQPGEVVINEFLADNVSDVKNEYNSNQDWIELYNNTNQKLSLSHFYLSDKTNNRSYFSFNDTTTIKANGFFMVWADEFVNSNQYQHTNFKLKNAGDVIYLSKGSVIADSVTFGQQTTDISSGRCADGTGNFTQLNFPSFGSLNCPNNLNEFKKSYFSFIVYPNPSTGAFKIKADNSSENNEVKIYNLFGQLLYSGTFSNESEINVHHFSSGVYIISLNSINKQLIIQK